MFNDYYHLQHQHDHHHHYMYTRFFFFIYVDFLPRRPNQYLTDFISLVLNPLQEFFDNFFQYSQMVFETFLDTFF